MLALSNVYKYIGNKVILDDINLNLQKAQTLALIGPSGAGKSTLLRSINLLEYPQSGILSIDDMRIDYANFNKKEELAIRQKSAMVFQHYNLFMNKNALENVAEALIVVQKMPKLMAYDIAETHLNSVGLGDKKEASVYELSGGQAQRVGIARALALGVKLLLFDEPTSALDPELVGEVLDIIKNINNKTMIIVTHEINFARNVADICVFMMDGKLIETLPTNEFFNNPRHTRLQQFLSKLKH